MKEAEHRILHLSYDIGDFNKTDKTTAVSNLIKATELFSEPTVVSLNRVNSPSKESTKNIKKGLISINSFGLPLGILHKSNLNRAYNRILKASEKDLLNLKNVDLIHSHKLTFEGYLGYRLSLRLKCPLLVTLRQTDFDVLRYRPDLRGLYKKIIMHSSGIFYLVPIMKRLLADRFGSNFYNENIEGKLSYLPNIIPTGVFTQRNNIAADAPLVTILRMNKRSVKRKNIKNLIKAASTLDRQFEIHIIGSGDYLKVVKNWISQYKAESKIKLIGEVNHSLIDEYYSKAKGFILPSFSESFGLVYAESLHYV